MVARVLWSDICGCRTISDQDLKFLYKHYTKVLELTSDMGSDFSLFNKELERRCEMIRPMLAARGVKL